jgi:CDP-diacylglycerol--serine O-phosphatidyltransferase
MSDAAPETAAGRHPQMIALHRIIPNMLTLMALIAGITSIQKAINGQFDTAVLMLLAAAILDTLDGAAARALKSSSEFGAQLDSLSDFLAFGVAPSLILYEWVLDDAGKLGWIATIALPVAAALRLARFNVMAKKTDDMPAWKKGYFSGVPSPAGAGLALFPIYIWFMLSPGTFDVFSFATPLISVWAIVVAALMVSRIPTFSFKKLRVPARGIIPVMALLGLLIAAMIHAPFVMLTLISIIYLVSMPIVFSRYRRKEKEYQSQPEDLSSLAFGLPPFDPLADHDESLDQDKPAIPDDENP